MRRLFFSFLVPSSVFVVASACGGKVTFELGSGGDGGAGQTGVATVAGNTTGAGKTTTSVTSTNVGSVVVGSAVTTNAVSVVAVSSSTGSPVGPPINCNGAPCNSGDICCFNPNGPGDHCGQEGQCDPGFIELDCDSPANCPSGICCATFDQNTQKYEGIACQPTCNGPADITLCTNNPPSPCPMGEQCHQSAQLGNGYRVCF